MIIDLSEEYELITRAQKNPEAFGILFERYYDQIFRYVLKRVANFELAQDIVSEVFLKALKNLWKFRWKKVPFSAWLYKISINEINYFFRKKSYKIVSLDILMRDEEFEISDQSNIHAEMIEKQEELERYQKFLYIQKQLLQLPVKYQEVISLRFFEHKKLSEIAQILGKKEGTVKSLVSRGLELLRSQLEFKANEMQPFLNLSIMEHEGPRTNL
jgi:RNA polymerase sigma-70 factor (ECF subfamily)